MEFDGGGEKIAFPMGVIEGANDGPTICIVGGVHGAESCGVAGAIDLYNYLKPENVSGKVIICTCFNRGALEQHVPFIVPQDNKSPLLGDRRTLPDDATYSDYMTHFFQTRILDDVDYFVELHGGDVSEDLMDFVMYPVTGNDEVDKKSQQIAEVFDIRTVLRLPVDTPSTPGTKVLEASFVNMATRGVPSLLAESGQFGIYNPKNAATHLKGLKNILVSVGILNEKIVKTNDRFCVKYISSMRSNYNGLWYPTKSIGDIVYKDELIGEIRDYFGETIQQIFAPQDSLVTAMRSNLYINLGHAMYYLAEPKE